MKNKKFWVSLMAGIMAGIMVLTLLLQLIPSEVQAASSSEIQNQIEAMEKEQAAIQQKLEELENNRQENQTEIEGIVAQKKLLDQQISLLHQQIANVKDQISAYAVLIADKQAELDKAEQRLEDMKELHLDRLRAMEENGQLSYWSVLFQANSFTDLLGRISMIQEIAAADRQRIEDMSAVAKEVEEAKLMLQVEQNSLMESRYLLAAKQAELDMKVTAAKLELEKLVAKGEEFEQWIDEQEGILSEFEDTLLDLEAEYDEAKYQEWLATSVPPTTKPPAPTYSGMGVGGTAHVYEGITWLTPCNYDRVSSPFGYRVHPVYGDWRLHKGVDLSIGCTPIYATRAGVVIFAPAYEDETAGYYVTIDHGDGYRSNYLHMCKRPDVKVGDFVAAGQVIGCVGSTGTSTGSHLHFGIGKINPATGLNEWINPMPFIS